MGVTFIIGRAGSGKTKHCFDSIVADLRADPLGPPIYWILPKQATFSAERELVTRSGLGGMCRARVVSFDLLGEEVLAACGGIAVPEITGLGRQMLLGHLLRSRENELKFFRSVARQPGLAARLDATFEEFDRCDKTPEDLAAAAAQLGDADEDVAAELLRNKIADFELLYRAYRAALGEERVDPHRRLEQVLQCLRQHPPLRSAKIYIDGFLDFTDRDVRMIQALGGICADVQITLMIDPSSKTLADIHHLPDEMSLFHRTESTYRRLMLRLAEAGATVHPVLRLSAIRRFKSPSLIAIEHEAFAKQSAHSNGDGIEFVEAPDRRREVDAVARRIRQSIREGCRLRDIAVLVRDIDDYHELIFASFREHEIPYFVDRRRSAGHHPLLQFTRSLLQVALGRWPHEAVFAMLRSGLCGLASDEIDELENYVLLHRIHGLEGWLAPEPWTFVRSLSRREEELEPDPGQVELAERMEALRQRIARPLRPFVEQLGGSRRFPLHEIVKTLFELFETLRVRRTLGGWIDQANQENDLEQSGEHQRVWDEVVKLFDQMVDLLGEQEISAGDFVEILEAGLEQFDLALPPPRVDQVLVGQVDRTRTAAVHTAFVLGLDEGQFPRPAREDSVLSDAERRALKRHRIEIDPESERRLLDENLLGYIAFTRASHRLIVSRSVSNDGKSAAPSAFWQRLRRMFPQATIAQEFREPDAPPSQIATPRQLVTALMRWSRLDEEVAVKDQTLASLYQWLGGYTCCSDAIDVMRYKAWRALSYDNDASLSPRIAERLMPGDLHASVTRIETFATCPFQHFARYHLRLAAREDADVTPMDLGNVYHQILEGIVRKTLTDREDWCQVQREMTARMIGEFAAEVGKSLRGELMLSTARNQYLLKRIQKTVERVCATQQTALSRGKFRPVFAELGFGIEGARLPPLEMHTPKGRRIMLRGKIDRVDACGDDVAVIDYKMRETRLSLHEVYYGLSLQLLTYLLVLQGTGKELFGTSITPVAAFYARLLRNLESVDHPDKAPDETDPSFDLRVKPRGIFDNRFLRDFDCNLDTGDSEVLQAFVTKDGTLGKLDTTDGAEEEAFAALLNLVRRKIGQLADQMIAGAINARPYRIGQDTPCPTCEFRSVCRFDPSINSYLTLVPMKRTQILEKVVEEENER